MTKTIKFKSTPDNWRKEYLGLKRNTIRKPDTEQDVRFDVISDHVNETVNLVNIEIENTITNETFTREVTDITYFNEWFIISW